jgi:hypothetical protein
MRRIVFVLMLACFTNLGIAQTVKEYVAQCTTKLLNSKFDSSNYASVYVSDKYSYGKTYLFACTKFKTLYDRRIIKALFEVTEADTIDAVKIYLSFDSTLIKELESDLGPPQPTWMAFPPGVVDTTHIIWDRYWFIGKYAISFRCTRYMPLLGETDDDYMIIGISPRIIKH